MHSPPNSLTGGLSRWCMYLVICDAVLVIIIIIIIISLNLPTLEERRNKSKITTMYKTINGNLSTPTNDLIPNHRPSREGYYKQLDTIIDTYKFSFLPSTIRLWNTPPPPPFVIHSPTLDEFCSNLNIHYDHTCAQQSF